MTSRLFLQFSADKTSDHRFQSDALPGVVNPHLSNLPYVRAGQLVWNVPIILWHITQTVVTHVNLCVEGCLIIGHDRHLALELLLLVVKLGLDGLSIDSLLVDVAEVIDFYSWLSEVHPATENHG